MPSTLTRARVRLLEMFGKRVSFDSDYLFDDLGPGDVAVDCGANLGLMTEKLAATGATVHSFDPDPYAFQKLRDREAEHRRNGRWDNVTIYNQAVGVENSTATLYFANQRDDDIDLYSECSSLYANKKNVDEGNGVDVEVIDLFAFLDQFEFVKLLKIDIEGAEVPILEKMFDEKIYERMGIVLVETHEKQIPDLAPRFRELRARVKRDGIKNVNLNWK